MQTPRVASHDVRFGKELQVQWVLSTVFCSGGTRLELRSPSESGDKRGADDLHRDHSHLRLQGFLLHAKRRGSGDTVRRRPVARGSYVLQT